MVDREKVLSGLKSCADSTGALCRTCPYDFVHNENCMGDMAQDALELLKDQQETIASLQGTICKLNAALAEQPKQKFFVDSDGKITPLPIQPQWISVEERLPDDASDVFAYYDDGTESRIILANYYKGCWYDCVFNRSIDDLETGFIRYWMSLPKPPEVKQDAET